MEQMREMQNQIKKIDCIIDVREEHIANLKDRVLHLLATYDSGYNIYGLPNINDDLKNLCEQFKNDVIKHYEEIIANLSNDIENDYKVKLTIDLGNNEGDDE